MIRIDGCIGPSGSPRTGVNGGVGAEGDERSIMDGLIRIIPDTIWWYDVV
jgi:hypothetical protein